MTNGKIVLSNSCQSSEELLGTVYGGVFKLEIQAQAFQTKLGLKICHFWAPKVPVQYEELEFELEHIPST